jgi:Cu/Ag efflux pump CusA
LPSFVIVATDNRGLHTTDMVATLPEVDQRIKALQAMVPRDLNLQPAYKYVRFVVAGVDTVRILTPHNNTYVEESL